MLKLALIIALILAISLLLLAIKILLEKKGHFPNTHVGGSKAMKERGIKCAQSQDFEMRQENPHRIDEKQS